MNKSLNFMGWVRGVFWEIAVYTAILVVAAVMRLWDLGSRAMHHDESLHAMYAWNLYSGNGFVHDPMMHGPFQIEAIAAGFLVLGDSDYTARLVSAMAGIVLVGLPFFLRDRLGRLGALFVSVMLALAPTMLYFSRFARNDIIMAVWALGLVISMWRYIDEGKPRYVYLTAALLALAFTTKETSYVLVTVLCLYLFVVVLARNWSILTNGMVVEEVSPPVALGRVVSRLSFNVKGVLTLNGVSREMSFFILVVTLSLPLWSAVVSIFQTTLLMNWSNLTLASPVGGSELIGTPARGGIVIAVLVSSVMIWLSALLGFKWDRAFWWRSALIFWAIWLVLQTTFFTNISGIGSGLWQSLGYWVVQQGEARGAQPWYYYLVITPVYEFLPLSLGIAASIFYIRRRDEFGIFLTFWAVGSFILYTIASEKMPWLVVNLTLPLIVLSGKFLSDVIGLAEWRQMLPRGRLLALLWLPVFILLAWSLAFVHFDLGERPDAFTFAALLAAFSGVVVLGALLARKLKLRNFVVLSTVSLSILLLAVGTRTGWNLSYQNGDTPVEMMVYTQTSPDIPSLARYVKATTDDGSTTRIIIDQTSGFAWPWHWYLRDHVGVGYVSYDGATGVTLPEAEVVLVHSQNKDKVDPVFEGSFPKVVRIKHRWWFPENYRGLTVGAFLSAIIDLDDWHQPMDYFLHRKVSVPLGSEDAYAYFSPGFLPEFTPLN